MQFLSGLGFTTSKARVVPKPDTFSVNKYVTVRVRAWLLADLSLFDFTHRTRPSLRPFAE